MPSAADVGRAMIATADQLPRLDLKPTSYTLPALPPLPPLSRWQRFRSWLRSIPLYL
jgi:hypothetical protein